MILRSPRSTSTDTLLPDTTLFRSRLHRARRCNIDDLSPDTLHRRQHRSTPQAHTAKVHTEDEVDILERSICDRLDGRDAGIVDQCVDPPVPRNSLLDDGAPLFLTRDFEPHDTTVPPASGNPDTGRTAIRATGGPA